MKHFFITSLIFLIARYGAGPLAQPRCKEKRHPGGYSRSMLDLKDGKRILMLTPVPVMGNRSNIFITREKVAD